RERGGGGMTAASRILRQGSGSLAAALPRGLFVVTPLQGRPGGLEIRRARQEVGPGVARDETLGLPHDIELAVAADFADEHGLGDVVVRKHLGGAAGEIWPFNAGQGVDTLVCIG